MKKLIALFLALVMAVSLMACVTKEEPKPEVEEPEVNAPEAEAPVEDEPAADEPATLPEEEQPAEDEPAADEPAVDEPAEVPEEDAPAEEMPEIEFMPEEKLNEMMGLMDQLVANINDELMVGTMEITSDMYEYYAIPAIEGAYAVVSMPMIGSIAHEVVLVEVPEGTDIPAFIEEMEGLMNPRKWVCVEAETTWVKNSGNYVLMVMSTEDMAGAIEENFNTVFGA